MKILIIDGSPADDPMGLRVTALLQSSIIFRGWDSEIIVLRDQKISNCRGDFLCWLKNPGECHIKDDNVVIAQKFMACDLIINITPVVFGGYSSLLKCMMDHLIQNISPFFIKINGEMHHQKRYSSYPDMLSIGWLDAPDVQAESIFHHLDYRNSKNMYTMTRVCGTLYTYQTEESISNVIDHLLTRVERFDSDPIPLLPEINTDPIAASSLRRVLLLVGSPRMKKSTSASLGNYLLGQLRLKGIDTETIYLYSVLDSSNRMNALNRSIERADLVVLAFPLYVDSMPGPVMAALEAIAFHRRSASVDTRFAAIVNCGYPEAHHNDNAIVLCGKFARTAGFAWMGGLALGGGEGLVHGTPLNELDGRALPIKKSLDIAAEALGAGKAVPDKARELLARSFIPLWLFRLYADLRWVRIARKYGTQWRLKDQPYQTLGKC